jgi:murein DD-endopeptidase MepM/ murein hydrolase activator NlpD
MLQGKAAVIRLATLAEMTLSGSLMEHDLHFLRDGEEGYVALQGIYALAEPGLYPLTIQGDLPGGATFSYSQMVPVFTVNYPYDTPLTVDPATVDPAVTKPEDEQWAALTAPVTPQRLWDGVFKLPSPLPVDYCLETGECWSSRFGNRRSYNGSPYNRFHTGLDVVGGVGTEIYAPASGEVVFAGPLTVRGNATVIDHGWGVYTAYMHQSEIFVEVGEIVEPGQLIGLVGGTGRVQGPHLHWEVWAGGVQVDPLDWLERAYP